jgi:hypothetical protein
VHCPHVGPVGGSPPNNYKCVNINYTVDYFNDMELFGAADVFNCNASSSMSCPGPKYYF